MGLRIPITGLSESINMIPEGVTLLFESHLDRTPNFLTQLMSVEAQKLGMEVNYITSYGVKRVVKDINRMGVSHIPFFIIENAPLTDWGNFINKKTLLVVDTFSILTSKIDDELFEESIKKIIDRTLETKSITILISQKGVLNEKLYNIVLSLVDGIMIFETDQRIEQDKRYIRIPKWVSGEPVLNNIQYTYSNGRVDIDTRSRVM
jgi:hypothetical protein